MKHTHNPPVSTPEGWDEGMCYSADFTVPALVGGGCYQLPAGWLRVTGRRYVTIARLPALPVLGFYSWIAFAYSPSSPDLMAAFRGGMGGLAPSHVASLRSSCTMPCLRCDFTRVTCPSATVLCGKEATPAHGARAN